MGVQLVSTGTWCSLESVAVAQCVGSSKFTAWEIQFGDDFRFSHFRIDAHQCKWKNMICIHTIQAQNYTNSRKKERKKDR